MKLRSENILPGINTFIPLGDYYPIPYSDESANRIKKYLERENFSLLSNEQAKDLTPEELNQLNYLLLSLESFYQQKNKYHTKREFLVPLTVNLDGPKYLKRLRIKSFLTSNKSSLLEKPEWWDNIKEVFITDIGEIFNYNYSFFWEVPDEKDYLMSQTPLDPDPEYVEKFRSKAEELISSCSDFEYIALNDILFKTTSSKSLEGKASVPNYSVKSKHLHLSRKRHEGKRVLLTTGPGTGRDAIINTVEDLNTIQYINENIRRFLEKNFSKHLLLNTHDVNLKKYKNMCKKSSFFYCRDIKKEGITKPKYLTKIILECLSKRYPDCTAFQNTDFYLGPWYENDTSGRGHGLGMANELTTLMQIIIFYLTNQELGEDGSYIAAKRALFLNDDAAILFDKGEEYQNIEDFADTDFFICSKLGVLAQKDKSFISENCCVFCEMYYSHLFPDQNDKESYVIRESNILLRAGSILEAKFLLGNMKGSLSHIENILGLVYSKYKYEFHQNEIDWPMTVGGLRTFKLRGVDKSLRMLRPLTEKSAIYRAYQASRSKRLWNFNKLIRDFKAPISVIFPSLLRETDESILNKIGIGSEFDLACRFFRPTKERKFHQSVKRLYKKRQKLFSESPILTWEMFCEDYAQNSNSNVELEEAFIERYIPVKIFTMEGFKDPYKVVNPITAYLNYKGLTSDKHCPKTIFGLYQQDCDLGFEKSTFARQRTLNTLSLIDRFEEDFESDLLVFPENEEDIPEFMESYPKPFLTSELVVRGNLLPIPKLKFRNKMLIHRKEIFGKYLSFYHLRLSQTMNWQEMSWIIGIERLFGGEYDEEFWKKVFKKYNEPDIDPKYKKQSSSSSSDDDDRPFKGPLDLIDTSNVTIDYSQMNIAPQYTEVENSSSEENLFEEIPLVEKSIIQQVEEEIYEKHKDNMFMIENNELEDADIDVYGSIGWIKWLVQQDVLSIENCCKEDDSLDYAASDMLSFKRKISTSDTMDPSWNENLWKMIRDSAKWSWISFYFIEYLQTPEPEEDPIEINLFE